MKLLVTGGAGFIGSNFIRYIFAVHPDWSVTNLDKLTYAGNLESLAMVADNPRHIFVQGDIGDHAKEAAFLAFDRHVTANRHVLNRRGAVHLHINSVRQGA